MVVVEEAGKLSIWSPPSGGDGTVDLSSAQPRMARIEKFSFAMMVGSQLWTSYGPTGMSAGGSRSHTSAATTRNSPSVRIYAPLSGGPHSVTPRPIITHIPTGTVTCGTIIPSQPGFVWLGHDSGHISCWSREAMVCVQVTKVSNYHVTALEGIGGHLWAGYKTGNMYVYDVEHAPWRVLKSWAAHEKTVTSIHVDTHSLGKVRLFSRLFSSLRPILSFDLLPSVRSTPRRLSRPRLLRPLLGRSHSRRLVRQRNDSSSTHLLHHP